MGVLAEAPGEATDLARQVLGIDDEAEALVEAQAGQVGALLLGQPRIGHGREAQGTQFLDSWVM